MATKTCILRQTELFSDPNQRMSAALWRERSRKFSTLKSSVLASLWFCRNLLCLFWRLGWNMSHNEQPETSGSRSCSWEDEAYISLWLKKFKPAPPPSSSVTTLTSCADWSVAVCLCSPCRINNQYRAELSSALVSAVWSGGLGTVRTGPTESSPAVNKEKTTTCFTFWPVRDQFRSQPHVGGQKSPSAWVQFVEESWKNRLKAPPKKNPWKDSLWEYN